MLKKIDSALCYGKATILLDQPHAVILEQDYEQVKKEVFWKIKPEFGIEQKLDEATNSSWQSQPSKEKEEGDITYEDLKSLFQQKTKDENTFIKE